MQKRVFLILILAVSTFVYSGCKGDECPVEEPEVNLLLGKWEATSFDGDLPDEELTFEFGDSSDFEFCLDDECSRGDYVWDAEAKIIFASFKDDDDYIISIKVDVDKLTETVLEGELIDLTDDGEEYDVEFERK